MSQVRLQRGAHLAAQNVFRSISVGFMPFFPETRRYRMEMDASMGKPRTGANLSKEGYWSLRPQEYQSAGTLEGSYPWLIRRSAYAAGEKIKGVGASGDLESLFKYNHQEKAVDAAQNLGIDSDTSVLATRLHALIDGELPAIYERRFGKSDTAELELLMILEEAEKAEGATGKGVLGISPRDFKDDSWSLPIKQLSSQDVDFWPEEIPLLKESLAFKGKEGPGVPQHILNNMGGFEMTAGGTYDADNKTVFKIGQSDSRVVAGIRGWLDNTKSQEVRFAERVEEDINAINTSIAGRAMAMSKGPDLDRVDFMNAIRSKGYKLYGNDKLQAQASSYSAAHMLLENYSTSWVAKEGRRILSRAKSFMDREFLKNQNKGPDITGGQILLEQVTLADGAMGFFALRVGTGYTADDNYNMVKHGTNQTTLDSKVRRHGVAQATTGIPGVNPTNIPQLELLGTWVSSEPSLSKFVKLWAVNALFKGAEANMLITSEEIQQAAFDATTVIGGKRVVGMMMKGTFETCLKHGIKLAVGEADKPTHTGIMGLTATGIAQGLEMKLQNLISSGEMQGKVAEFYIKMMEMSNTLSDQWKSAVPPGTATGVLMSKEWTFGDGFVKGWTKHRLGLWGPTGDADGSYDNWSDTEYKYGENVSISPFLTARRAGVGRFGSGKARAGDYL